MPLDKSKKIRNGYLNTVYKKGDFYIRKPKAIKSNWANEVKINNALKMDSSITKDGTLTRKWIKGKTISKWTPQILNLVKEKITEVHNLKIKLLSKHDWTKYDKWLSELSVDFRDDFKNMRQEFKNEKLVVSHNDLNKENMLIHNNKITFIDFEWANMNFDLFDYVQFYITEGELLVDKNEKFNQILFISLCYFYLWTFDVPESSFVFKLREKYLKMLSKQ